MNNQNLSDVIKRGEKDGSVAHVSVIQNFDDYFCIRIDNLTYDKYQEIVAETEKILFYQNLLFKEKNTNDVAETIILKGLLTYIFDIGTYVKCRYFHRGNWKQELWMYGLKTKKISVDCLIASLNTHLSKNGF